MNLFRDPLSLLINYPRFPSLSFPTSPLSLSSFHRSFLPPFIPFHLLPFLSNYHFLPARYPCVFTTSYPATGQGCHYVPPSLPCFLHFLSPSILGTVLSSSLPPYLPSFILSSLFPSFRLPLFLPSSIPSSFLLPSLP